MNAGAASPKRRSTAAQPSPQKKIYFLREKDLKLESACLRFDGWLEGMWKDGCHYCIRDAEKFAAATRKPTRSGRKARPLRPSYVRKVFRVHQRLFADKYDFERVRIGRSERVKIVLRGAAAGVTQHHVLVRLAGYIRQAVLQRRIAHVDALFLQRFAATTGLPLSMIEIAARKLRRIRGCKLRRRGVGHGKKLVVSPLQISPAHSSPTERRDRKSVGPAAVDQTGSSGAAGAPSRQDTADSSPPAKRRAFRCTLPPFCVADRWISQQRLLSLACWLAVNPLRAAHVRGFRVLWRFAHARNFAHKALQLGFDKREIVDAWSRAVSQSHDDSLDVDQASPGAEVPAREPSSAVVYAWRILRADSRSTEQRWRTVLEAPRRPRSELAVKLPRPQRVKTPAPADSLPAEKRAELRTIEAALKERGLSTAALMRLPRAERDSIMADIRALLQRKISR